MTIAALDIGSVRVGVAVSDELGLMAHPRPPLDGRDIPSLLQAVMVLAREEKVERFVLGYPLDARGLPGPAAKKVKHLARQIANATRLPVELVDERLTTVQAHRRMRENLVSSRKRKGRIDGAAASIILQTWLDAKRPREQG